MEKLPLQPSEYFARQCYIGASFMRPWEVVMRDKVGVDRIMWGNDYPHKEASSPFSREHQRLSFGGVDPREVALMFGVNVAKVYDFDVEALRPARRPRVPDRRARCSRSCPRRHPGGCRQVPGVRRARGRPALTRAFLRS